MAVGMAIATTYKAIVRRRPKRSERAPPVTQPAAARTVLPTLSHATVDSFRPNSTDRFVERARLREYAPAGSSANANAANAARLPNIARSAVTKYEMISPPARAAREPKLSTA